MAQYTGKLGLVFFICLFAFLVFCFLFRCIYLLEGQKEKLLKQTPCQMWSPDSQDPDPSQNPKVRHRSIFLFLSPPHKSPVLYINGSAFFLVNVIRYFSILCSDTILMTAVYIFKNHNLKV